MKIVKFIFSFLFALIFINAGLNKFLHYSPMPKMTPEQTKIFAAFSEIGWLFPLVGIVEILGGVLFIFPKTKALGAIILLPVMVGIVIHNLYRDPSQMGIITAIVMFLINIWAIIDEREKYKALIS
ncbi:DoxX family protein [Chryseobacterium shigense]|uniref:DoxX-like family protein n=1 Tax=Chryseobacterium shigense TaxID=297244 RepID=A0A1N7J6F5_9FLAO|nr:DoxX family protein [Chryseobacterium shigense]PQA93603.1 DoxX family protein [Chryseobacterium shigense]SIS44831.1 DoxX-like family protein [Chryseobacterium shigense]